MDGTNTGKAKGLYYDYRSVSFVRNNSHVNSFVLSQKMEVAIYG